MMAQTSSQPPQCAAHEAMGRSWVVLLARMLGRSSRWATVEADNLVKVARDIIVGSVSVPPSPNGKARAGSSIPVLVEELSELVSRSECRALETDKRFWCLVRELYTRRPWSPRKPRDLVETVGFEIKETAASENVDGKEWKGSAS